MRYDSDLGGTIVCWLGLFRPEPIFASSLLPAMPALTVKSAGMIRVTQATDKP